MQNLTSIVEDVDFDAEDFSFRLVQIRTSVVARRLKKHKQEGFRLVQIRTSVVVLHRRHSIQTVLD